VGGKERRRGGSRTTSMKIHTYMVVAGVRLRHRGGKVAVQEQARWKAVGRGGGGGGLAMG